MSKQFVALIIAKDGITRNASLVKFLKDSKLFKQIEIVEGVTPETINKKYLDEQLKQSSKILGREMTVIEVAVKVSHEKAYQYAFQKNYSEVLILEDDVEFKNLEMFKNLFKKIPNLNQSCIITFYSPAWSIWRKSKFGLKAIFPPAGAAAYIINSEAIRIALSGMSFGVADWPTWARKVDFYLLENPELVEFNSHSYIESERLISKSNILGRQKRILRFLSRPSSLNLTMTIWPSLIWKTSTLLLRLFRKRDKNDSRRIIISI